jgi:hypothetical protein
MKKSDYGELKFTIEVRENAIIIDGGITVVRKPGGTS